MGSKVKFLSSITLSMNHVIPAYRIFSLGDEALTVDFGNRVNADINRIVLALRSRLQADLLPGIRELVPAYASLTAWFWPGGVLDSHRDGFSTAAERVAAWLEAHLREPVQLPAEEPTVVTIPVCYDPVLGNDLGAIATTKGLSVEEVIQIHSGKIYRVYMLGFLPGFPYLGDVDERIAVPRKSSPVAVRSGSIGIAGAQTGIYPVDSPGGWMIVGHTPVTLFQPDAERPVLFQPGNRVRFISISYDEFANY